MNTPALPAYLQNRQSQGVAARATIGMGGVLPPHISIRGNSFTLVDAAGNQQPVGPTLDACVVDISDHMNKRYYENEWTPNSDEPPTCWSSNGVGPSREANVPQSPICATCRHNERGSAISKLSQAKIKACRDEKFIALLLPQYPGMLFQLVIPPGSFKNWQAFTVPFLKGGTDISDVLVRFGFQPQANGVMTFQATSYIDEATAGGREAALASKATDVLVGRNDVPIAITHQPTANLGGQHAGVDQQSSGQAPVLATGALGTGVMQQPTAQFGGAPQAPLPFAPGQGAPAQAAGAFGQPAQVPAPNAATTSPSERPPRKRRTQAEIAADNATKAAQAGAPPPVGSAPVQPAQVPFPVNQPTQGFGAAPATPSGATFTVTAPANITTFGQPAAAPQPAGAQFGIAPGQDPNGDPQLAAMLASLGNQ